MNTITLDVVWAEHRFDSGWYEGKVVRDGDLGRLTVSLMVGLHSEIPVVLHEETVKVDRDDTDKWRTRCAAVISNPDLRMVEHHHE
jgi:hypothetical protein